MSRSTRARRHDPPAAVYVHHDPVCVLIDTLVLCGELQHIPRSIDISDPAWYTRHAAEGATHPVTSPEHTHATPHTHTPNDPE